MGNSLQKDFEARKTFYTNRASAVFPIHFVCKENDLQLSWLNYWSIKNKLDPNLITVNLRLYDSKGNLEVRTQTELQPSNNLVSMREYIKKDIFKGMVEIEIISSSSYSELRRKRYQTFDSGNGKDFENGKLALNDLYNIAKDSNEIALESGKQELFENIINQYI